MKFDLNRPCSDCPFRSDRPFPLRRAGDILRALTQGNKTFSCHKTVTYTNRGPRQTEKTQHCAGALLFVKQTGAANQLIQIAERLGLYDPSKLSTNVPVYKSIEQMVKGCK